MILAPPLYELTPVKATLPAPLPRPQLLQRRRPGGSRARCGWASSKEGSASAAAGRLMAALFALGVMSIAWMLLIAGLIAIEKLLPWTLVTIGTTAAVLALLGVAVIVAPAHVPWLTIPMSM